MEYLLWLFLQREDIMNLVLTLLLTFSVASFISSSLLERTTSELTALEIFPLKKKNGNL